MPQDILCCFLLPLADISAGPAQTMWLEAETAKHMGKLGKIFEVATDPGLDTIKKAACRKAFDEADENGNGLLDRGEIGLLSRCGNVYYFWLR